MTRVLVTNDDGIDSPGLLALAQCALDQGWETVVAAPAEESSGTSAGLNAAAGNRQVMVSRRDVLPGAEGYAVAGHPGLIALMACHDGFGPKPDLVLSGINRGGNIGRAILHSGTVGAAMTAGINGVRAMAVSLDVGLADDVEPLWENAAKVVRSLLPGVLDLAGGSVLNVNVPNAAEVGELRWARLATYGRAQTKLTRVDGDLVEIATVEVAGELEAGTDAALLGEGYATVTPVRSISEDAEIMNSGVLVR